MEKPNIKDYQYSNGELKDPIEYVEALESYIEFKERDFKKMLLERKKEAIAKVNNILDFDKRDARVIITSL